MKRIFQFLFGSLVVFSVLTSPLQTIRAADATSGTTPTTQEACPKIAGTTGVLTKTQIGGGLNCYIAAALSENMPYIILFAIILIVWSGIEYMLSGTGITQAAKAKERLIGIISGLIFYFLIWFLLSLLTSGFEKMVLGL
jgi:hypothetical protein